MELSDILLVVGAALLGWLVGVIINALADDLPLRHTPRVPHYPNGSPRPLLAWSGLLAFVTGQREGQGIQLTPEEEQNHSLEEIAHLAYDTRLGWRHPLVELGMAALFGGILAFAPDHPRTLIWFLFLSVLMLITIIDLEHRLILFVIIVPSVALTLVLNALFPDKTPDGDDRPFIEYVLGGLLGGGVFFLMFLGGGVFADAISAVRGRSLSEVAFGFGDVMLAILCGCMIGWRAMVFAMFITVFAGAIGAISYMVYRLLAGKRYTFYTALPYGPYIVLGTVIMMLFIEPIRDLFQS